MIKDVPLERLEICDGDNHRHLTFADVEHFAT